MIYSHRPFWKQIDPRNSHGVKSGGKVVIGWLRSLRRVIPWLCESREPVSQLHQREPLTAQLPWTDGMAVPKNGEYDFVAPFKSRDNSAETELIRALRETTAFKRLGDIRFLGALDYFLVASPNGMQSNTRYTRLQHSLGVAALAKAYLDIKKHTPHQRMLCVAAALLHDIGHPPFSHTLEPVFEENFGLNHHKATEFIISGLTPLGREVADVLHTFGINPLAVLSVLNGGDDIFDSFFSSPINFDTIEGILRARNYLKMQKLGLSPLKVMLAAAFRAKESSQQIVDDFWASKHEVYTLVIRSRLGVLHDTLFQAITRKHIGALSPADFFVTESEIFKKIPVLREALRKDRLNEIARSVLPSSVPFQARLFYIDASANFASGSDSARYRQTKRPTSLTLDEMLPA